MATPFKLKSGNASAFKNLGSSPVKDVIPTSSQMPENWNKGTTPNYSSTSKAKTQNFRNAANKIKTLSSKTNVGNKVVKNTKIQDVKFGARQGYNLDKNLRMGKGYSTATRLGSRAGQIAETIVKGVSKATTALTVPLILYDMYKSGQKHSGGKTTKNQASFWTNAKNKENHTKSSANKGFNFNKGK